MITTRKTSVVILNYNSLKFIIDTIERVLAQTSPAKEIIVVDNNSSDQSIAVLGENYPDIPVIKLSENYGFSKGMNIGIKKSAGEYVLCLNPDVYLTERYIELLESAMSYDPRLGIAMGKILNMKTMDTDYKIIDSMGGRFSYLRLNYWEPEFGKPDIGQYSKNADIYWATGSACIIRKQTLEDVKKNNEYFDEDFFMQCEDLDISWRARNKGWKIKLIPAAIAYHYREGSSPDKGLGEKLMWRNRYLTIIKNIPLLYLILFSIPIIGLELCRLLKYSIKKPYLYKYTIDSFRMMPRIWKKRF